jgi:hypothetical protein
MKEVTLLAQTLRQLRSIITKRCLKMDLPLTPSCEALGTCPTCVKT